MKNNLYLYLILLLLILALLVVALYGGHQVGYAEGIRESCKKTYQECLPGWGCKEFTYP